MTRLVEVVPDWMLALVGGLGVLTLGFAGLSAVSTVRASRSERQRRRLAQDVGLLQSALLPVLPPEVGSTTVSASYRPADGPAAGGDLYDAFELPGGRTGVIVGDVEGHGRRALPLTALVRYTIRAHMESGLEPRLALQAAGTTLFSQLQGHLVTVVAAVYEPVTGHLTYACAGHPQPILIGCGHRPILGAASPAIGAGALTGRRQVIVALPPGSSACFYTDGLADVPADEVPGRLGFGGLAEHVTALGAEVDANAVLAPLAARTPQHDDMTALVLRPLTRAQVAPRPLQVEQLEVRGSDLVLARAWLDECGVGCDRAEEAIGEARAIVARNGTAVLEVELHARGISVDVRRSEFVTLPLQRRAAPDESAPPREARSA